MSNYSCNEHGKNYVDGCLACDFPREFEELERENEDLRYQLNEALRHLGNVVSVREMVFHPTAEWYAAEEYYSKQENSDE